MSILRKTALGNADNQGSNDCPTLAPWMMRATAVSTVALLMTLSSSGRLSAKKGDGGEPPHNDQTLYSVTESSGDLDIVGAFSADGEPLDWAQSGSNQNGEFIMVNRPIPMVCISNDFLDTTDEVELNPNPEYPCADGVISTGNKPNWGSLFIGRDSAGDFVTYRIGETLGNGKTRTYSLSTLEPSGPEPGPVTITSFNGTFPNGTGDANRKAEYVVSIPEGTVWSLIEDGGNGISTTLISTTTTTLTLTEYVE